MPYIAIKRQAVMRNGEKVWVDPGDHIPEADKWPNVGAWEQQGWVRYVPESNIPKPALKPKPVPLPEEDSTPVLTEPISEEDPKPSVVSRVFKKKTKKKKAKKKARKSSEE
jgi:hypothetical protein